MPHNSMRGSTTIRIWRTIRHQRWGAGLALALAMVVGFGVPLGDASSTQAAYASQASDEPTQNEAVDPVATEEVDGPAEEEAPANTELADDSAETPEQLSKDLKAEPLTRSIAPFAVGPEGGEPPYVYWETRNAQNQLVGGATYDLQGPRTGWLGYSGIDTVPVQDNTGQSGYNGLDLDPTPGEFLVKSIGSHQIESGNRYRVRPNTAAPGTYWTSSTDWKEIPQTGILNPNSGAGWSGQTYNFGAFEINEYSSGIVCEPGVFYSVNANGQVFEISGEVRNPLSGNWTGSSINGLGIGQNGSAMYAFRRTGDVSQNVASILKYTDATGWETLPNTGISTGNSNALIGGAVNLANDRYLFGGFHSQNSRLHFRLYEYNPDGGITNNPRFIGSFNTGLASNTTANGDMAFDAAGNLYIVRSGTNTNIYTVTAETLSNANGGTLAFTGTQASNLGGNLQSVNGIAFDGDGTVILGSGTTWGRYDPTDWSLIGSLVTNLSGSTDLASCSSPANLTLQKNVVDRMNPSDQFDLRVYRGSNPSMQTLISETRTSGNLNDVQEQQVGPVAVLSGGTYTISETVPDPSSYTSSWECTEGGDVFAHGSGVSAEVTIPTRPGATVLCTFTNSPLRPDLQIRKDSSPESGEMISEGDTVEYKLTFDNSQGTAEAPVEHIDWLADVLDDADFKAGSIRYGDGTETEYPEAAGGNISGISAALEGLEDEDPRLAISGTVPTGETRTVWFTVTVKQNDDDLDQRQDKTGGFVLNNFLTAKGETPPATCERDEENPSCTTHPINAWTVEKNSRPADGARLHKGGNAHYQLVAKKLTPETRIDQLVFTDDLTDVFRVAGFAPNAAVPGGALSRGIYFFDENGNTLDQAPAAGEPAQPTAGTGPQAAYEGDVAVPNPSEDSNGRWTITSAPVDVPSNAVRAELWFAVQAAESPAGFPDPLSAWSQANAPKTGDKFTNFATATSSTMEPARCDTRLNPNPSVDGNFPAACQVTHELQDNYFTIRKDAAGPAVDAVNLDSEGNVSDPEYGADKTGMWNMVGHEFEIRDTADGDPSRFLCRTDYNPGSPDQDSEWDGEFTGTGTQDWGEASATLAAIIAWNNAHPDLRDDEKLPLCALLYAQGTFNETGTPTIGGQDGRWRSENLPEGTYWLVETKAPSHQISVNGSKTRPVPGIQLLAEPIKFQVWGDEPDENPFNNGQSHHGLGQLDVDGVADRCAPGNEMTVADRPVACVNPTGYLLLVKDPAAITLPLSGGTWLSTLTVGGAVLLLVTIAGTFWWRRQQLKNRNLTTTS